MKKLRPIENKKEYVDIIYKKIISFYDEVFFDFLNTLSKEMLINSSGLDSALRSGKIHYENGLFIGKFNNTLSKELEDLGGVYSKSKGGYKVKYTELPPNLQQSVSYKRIIDNKLLQDAQKYLQDLETQLDYVYQKLDFTKEVKVIGSGLDTQLQRSLKTINVIPAEMTDYQIEQISKNFTNNLDYYIKKWTQSEIIKMREGLQEIALKGATQKQIADFIQSEKLVSRNKAKFLARNETKLLMSQYQANRYKEAGVDKYKWSTIMDGRERGDHKELNGKIFSWDNPPIIDKITGERGNPGDAYNCRCKAVPVITDAYWSQIKGANLQ